VDGTCGSCLREGALQTSPLHPGPLDEVSDPEPQLPLAHLSQDQRGDEERLRLQAVRASRAIEADALAVVGPARSERAGLDLDVAVVTRQGTAFTQEGEAAPDGADADPEFVGDLAAARRVRVPALHRLAGAPVPVERSYSDEHKRGLGGVAGPVRAE